MIYRTSEEALRGFLEPIQEALGCIGNAKINVSQKPSQSGKIHSWVINQGNGLALKNANLFKASMWFEIVNDGSGWRVSTRSYLYSLLHEGEELFALHWHPDSNSGTQYSFPHAHISIPAIKDMKKEHLPTGRLSFEDAIEWSIRMGIEPVKDDWQQILQKTKSDYLLKRTWTN